MFHVLPHGELRNLILAVIVEKAAEAREKDSARKKEKKDQEREAHLVELAMLFDSMDENCNGKLSLEEMLNGFDCNPKFRQLMDFMDIAREEVEVVFNVLDGNASEEVDYLEFCKHLSTFRKRDPVMMQSMMKYSVMELRHLLKQDIMQVEHNLVRAALKMSQIQLWPDIQPEAKHSKKTHQTQTYKTSFPRPTRQSCLTGLAAADADANGPADVISEDTGMRGGCQGEISATWCKWCFDVFIRCMSCRWNITGQTSDKHLQS